MATIIDALVITMGLDPKGVAEGMKKADSTIQGGVKAIMGYLAPLAGMASFGALLGNYLSTADAVGKLSGAMGVNVEDLQAWQEAATRAGGSAEGFVQSVSGLTQRIGEFAATGEGEGKKIFETLGIAAKDGAGNARDAIAVMSDLAVKFEGLNKTQALALGQKLGLDQGTIMLLQSGKKAVTELVARQKELGVYTKRDTELTAKANDAWADLKQSVTSAAAVVLRVAVPALTWLAEKLTPIAVWVRQNEPFILAFLGTVATVITARMVPALWGMARAALAAMAPFAPLIIIAGLLAIVIDDLIAYINGGESAFADFWAMLGTGPEIAAALAAGWEIVKTVFDAVLGVLTELARAFIKLTNFDLGGLAESGRKILGIFGDLWSRIMDILGLREKLEGMLSAVKEFFGFGDKGNVSTATSLEASAGAHAMAVMSPPMPPAGVSPGAARAGGNATYNSNSDTQVTVQKIEVVTQATDANGIARDMGGATNRELSRSFVNPAVTGMRP